MTIRNRLATLILTTLIPLVLSAGEPAIPGPTPGAPAKLFDQDGYRIDQFQAPVTIDPPGAKTVTTQGMQALIADGQAVLVDVLPAPPRPSGLAPDTLWMPPPHENIPGSVWLPDVGQGRLSDALKTYLARNLGRLSGGDRAKPLIFYCKPDCWMSWNAAKRAASDGYTTVYWYPDGVAGWTTAGLTLAPSQPVPMN
jgi:PQQ-dependent catabolism-associated CXXCW motif protein